MQPPANAKRVYQVRPGFTFGTYDEKKPGDLVELTEYEAQGFEDKLVFLVVEEAPAPSPVVLDLADGVNDQEAHAAAQALNQRKRGKRG